MNNYDIYAEFYDNFKSTDNYDIFLKYYLEVAQEYDFKGKDILDLGCGTGNSMLPLLEKGFNVVGIDGSSEMLKIAEKKLINYSTELYNYDITNFNLDKSFDLIISVDDVINHLTEKDMIDKCFASVKKHLSDSGLFIFDVNTLNTFNTFLNKTICIELDKDVFIWQSNFKDSISNSNIITFSKDNCDSLYKRTNYTINERYYSFNEISKLLAKNGLQFLGMYGLGNRKLNRCPSENRDVKIIYIAKN